MSQDTPNVNLAVSIFDTETVDNRLKYDEMGNEEESLIDTTFIDNQLVVIVTCFSIFIMVMLMTFCYKIIKEKDRKVRRIDNKKERMDTSGNIQETSETSSFVFNAQMTKI